MGAQMKKLVFTTITSILFISCARAPIKDRAQAMRPAPMPEFQDDLGMSSLISALEANIRFLKEKPEAPAQFGFGPRVVEKSEYIAALETLLSEAKDDPTGARFHQALKNNFETFEVYGRERWGEVLITSYFEPVIPGSKKRTKEFSQPIYARPKDMVEIDLTSFYAVRPELAQMNKKPLEQRTRGQILRGIWREPASTQEMPRIVAYPDRAGIDTGSIKAEVLAYVHPIDAFILEIQGSGVVKLPNGKELKVGYSAQNGHPYVPIGKHLFDVIPKEKMSLWAIENHLRSLPMEEARKLMQLNPSYVFFRPLESRGVTYSGMELIDGRTIATDYAYFPKGALAFLEFEKPEFADEKAIEPSSWTRASRFVFDHDTGGAIRGPGRVDLFTGRGALAKQTASVMKNPGRLYYLVPKAGTVEQLRAQK